MSILKALFNTYEYCEEKGLVDNHENNETVLLPLYHQNMKSNGNNIVLVSLDKESKLERAEFIGKDKSIICPVTEESVARSGKFPPPHPLVDKLLYMIYSKERENLVQSYLNGLNDFISYVQDEEVKEFLVIIKNFIDRDNILEDIAKRIYNSNYTLNGMEVCYKDDKGKEKKIDFSSVFITFEVVKFIGVKNVDVTGYKALHKAFIDYINSKETSKNVNEEDNTKCNISGRDEQISLKHRGLLGTAKVVSVSNNKETYIGRFRKGSDIINIGRESSEKIHLMLKYLLENKNSNKWLGDSLYLVNWFFEDIGNEKGFDITIYSNKDKNKAEYEEEDDDENDNDEVVHPVTEDNKYIGDSFISGKQLFRGDESYYIMLVDKPNDGRISIKHYKEMQTSELIEKLEDWKNRYVLERFNYKKKKFWIPSLNMILKATYGIEQNGVLDIKGENLNKFRKDQFQKILEGLLEGRGLPKNIINMLKLNIRRRLSYKKTWNKLLNVALAVLSDRRKEELDMRDRLEQNKDYLFGRLLSIYEEMERATFRDKNSSANGEKKEKGGSEENRKEDNNKRVTNAEKYWSAYINRPADYMNIIESKVKVYETKLRDSDIGIYSKMIIAKEEIMALLDEISLKEELNEPLKYDFIFGYYAQRKAIFTKKEDKQNE